MPPLPITPSLLRQLEEAQKVPVSEKKHALQIVPVKLRVWLADQNDVACRPWYIFCLELYPRGQVINQVIHDPASEKPDASALFSFLLNHIAKPPPDEPTTRPTHVSFVDDSLTDALRPHLKRLGIQVGTLTLADGVDEYVRKFSKKLVEMDRATRGDSAERPGLLSVKGITTDMGLQMAQAAVSLHRDEPWKRIPERIALEIRLPSADNETYRDRYYVTILGSDKKGVQGFALMASLSSLREKYKRAMLSKTTDLGDSEDEETPIPSTNGERVADDVLLCANCGRRVGENVAADGTRYVDRCAGCHRLLYCSEDCQKHDWRKRHREECELARLDKEYVFRRDEWGWLKRELALLFLDPTAIPFDDLDAFDDHSWPLVDTVSPPLYPMPFATIQSFNGVNNRIDRPTTKELESMTLIANALQECISPVEGILHLQSGVSISLAENLADSINP